MIRICRSISEIIKYKKVEIFKSGGAGVCPVLDVDKALFAKARDLFAEGHVVVEVQDGNGHVLFYLKKQDDGLEKCVNFDCGDLLKEKSLDVSFIERFHCFVFKELEEYTYELAEFIRNRYPDTHIFFLDSYAKYFWDDSDRVKTLNSIYELDGFWQGQYILVCSNTEKGNFVLPEDVMLVYDSINVMSSLCWARKLEHLGPSNPDKTILLIDMEFGKYWGLAYVVRATCVLAYMAHERGWIPVVNLAGNNLYTDTIGSNMWEQYFAPLSDISIDEALKSYNVISVKANGLTPQMIYVNPYFRENWHRPNRHPRIDFAEDVKNYLLNSSADLFAGENGKVMGVIARGTDAKKEGVNKERIDCAVWECLEIMESKGYDKLFLATEDAAYFDAFAEAFKDRLLYIEQKRVSGLMHSGKPVGEMLDIPVGKREDFGRTYLLVTYCLSQCDALVYNIPSGGYYLANKWRNKPYEFTCQLEEKTQIDDVVKCMEMIDRNACTAIYGTGIIGRRLSNVINQKNASKVVYCDRKAEKESYLFEGYDVISPEEMLMRYRKGDIQRMIIATVNYAEEIYHSLMMKGVDPGHVLRVKSIML